MSYLSSLPFLIGNDICHIARIRRILKGRLGPQFVRRILRDEEIENPTTAGILRCILKPTAQHAQSIPKNVKGKEESGFDSKTRDTPGFTRAVEFMAGRFAAKEAVIKAHPNRRLTFRRIAILRAHPSVLDASGDGTTKGENGDGREDENGAVFDGEKEEKEESRLAGGGGDGGVGRGPLVALIRARDGRGRGDGHDLCASVSISHDSEYATAVCLGINSLGRAVM